MPNPKTARKRSVAAEDARIQAGIDDDADNPEFSAPGFTAARSAQEMFGPDIAQGLVAMRRPVGRPKSEDPKVFTAIRLDADVIGAFKATGKGWQTRINAALKDWLKSHSLV